MADPAQVAAAGANFVCWVVITKLQMRQADGSDNDEESSKDYIAMHLYNNPSKGSKVL